MRSTHMSGALSKPPLATTPVADCGGLHFAAAGVAADQSAEQVVAGCRCAGSIEAAACAVAASGSSAAQELCFGESFDRHDCRVGGFFWSAAPDNAGTDETPTGSYANIYPRAPTCADSTKPTSMRSPAN
jgi:hypothetical protein